MEYIKYLPTNIQCNIFEFAPCPKAKQAKTHFLSLLNTKKIGIPYWQIQFNNTNKLYEKYFIIPSNDYFEFVKIKGLSWKIPEKLDDCYYDNRIFRLTPYRYLFSYKECELGKNIRNNIGIYPGDSYNIFLEGGFDAPIITIPYNFLDDYDILYTLKVTRGKSKEDGIKNILDWADLHRKIHSPQDEYTYRIPKKWLILSEKN